MLAFDHQGGSSDASCCCRAAAWSSCGSRTIPGCSEPCRSEAIREGRVAGEQALAAIKTIRFHGRITIYPGDFELTYEETRARMGAEAAGRTDLTIQGLDLVQSYDGHGDGWRINPFQGRKDPERMSADEGSSTCRPTQRLSRGRCSHREPTGAMSNILAGTILRGLSPTNSKSLRRTGTSSPIGSIPTRSSRSRFLRRKAQNSRRRANHRDRTWRL